MKIKMLRRSLALDGFCLAEFIVGEVYEVRESVGCYLINRKKAKFKLENNYANPLS